MLVLCVRVLLRLMSLPQVLGALDSKSATGEPAGESMDDLVYYVDRWLQLFPYNSKGNCFPRSVALYRIARDLGYPVRFYCGVKKDTSFLSGHAWLILDGDPFHELSRQWQYFTVTFSYPPDPTLDNARERTAHGEGSRITSS
jgi:hypothetical protein